VLFAHNAVSQTANLASIRRDLIRRLDRTDRRWGTHGGNFVVVEVAHAEETPLANMPEVLHVADLAFAADHVRALCAVSEAGCASSDPV
jgi:hypothetical protein